jgi:hypothetical protein
MKRDALLIVLGTVAVRVAVVAFFVIAFGLFHTATWSEGDHRFLAPVLPAVYLLAGRAIDRVVRTKSDQDSQEDQKDPGGVSQEDREGQEEIRSSHSLMLLGRTLLGFSFLISLISL